jgi:hypothetical protein
MVVGFTAITTASTNAPTTIAGSMTFAAKTPESIDKNVLACEIASQLKIDCSLVMITKISYGGKRRILLQSDVSINVDFVIKATNVEQAKQITTTLQSTTFQTSIVQNLKTVNPTLQGATITALRVSVSHRTTPWYSTAWAIVLYVFCGQWIITGIVYISVTISNKTRKRKT